MGKINDLPTSYFSATGIPIAESVPVIAPAPTPGEEWLSKPLQSRGGSTPLWIKRLVEDAIRDVFDEQLKERRGELCLYVSESVARLLRRFGIGARVVAGSARWTGYPIWFTWKGYAEFHAWAETEFSEIVDLGCDSLHKRRNLSFKAPPGPPTCWDKPEVLASRQYTEIPDGAIQVGLYGVNEPHLAAVPSLLVQFVESNEAKYREKYATDGT